MRTWARLGRGAIVIATLPLAWGLASASCTTHELADPPRLTDRGAMQLAWAREHLSSEWHGYGVLDDMGVRAFDAILLSHLAMGLANVAALEPGRREALRPLAAEVARRAVSAEASPMRVVAERASIGDHNLYASHVLLVLGLAHRLGVRDHDALADRLARHLVQRSLASPDFHARSYPGSARWPADQALTLAALHVHDREHGTDLADRPIAGWLRWLARHRTGELPWSTTGSLSYARVPRGCALSWMSMHVTRFAPEEGARLYAAYRAEHGISWLGWRGFREWPRGGDRGSDVDAGPVILGWGTAATGIGLGAARLHGDEAQVAGIERIADTVGLRVPRSARYLLAPTLGQAILFAGETATTWDEPIPARRTDADLPIGPLLLLALVLAIDAWLVRGIVRAGPRGTRAVDRA